MMSQVVSCSFQANILPKCLGYVCFFFLTKKQTKCYSIDQIMKTYLAFHLQLD